MFRLMFTWNARISLSLSRLDEVPVGRDGQ